MQIIPGRGNDLPSRLKEERGSSSLEFALSLPLLLLLSLGTIQMVLLAYAYQIANYAAYCAARAGVVHGEDHARMEKAAAIASLSITGKAWGEGLLPEPEVSFTEILFLPGLDRAADIHYLYRIARGKTKVKAEKSPEGDLTATVTHHFQLQVPVIGQLISRTLPLVRSPLGEETARLTELYGAPHLPLTAEAALPLEPGASGG